MATYCGVDIVYIPKIKEFLDNPALLKKFFHPSELKNKDVEHLAGIIAAKEAFYKALGMAPKFKDVEIQYESSGRPKILTSENLKCDVSISHDKDYAIAMVIIEK